MGRHVSRVFPVFAVSDIADATRHYREKLGFSVSWTWGEPAQRAAVALDDVEIQLVAPGPGVPPGAAVAYCHMTGIDEYYAACKARGAHIALELGPRPWGVRDFRVLDPAGNQIGFAEFIDG